MRRGTGENSLRERRAEAVMEGVLAVPSPPASQPRACGRLYTSHTHQVILVGCHSTSRVCHAVGFCLRRQAGRMIEEPEPEQRNRSCEPQELLSTAAAPTTCQAFANVRLPPHCGSAPHAPLAIISPDSHNARWHQQSGCWASCRRRKRHP